LCTLTNWAERYYNAWIILIFAQRVYSFTVEKSVWESDLIQHLNASGFQARAAFPENSSGWLLLKVFSDE